MGLPGRGDKPTNRDDKADLVENAAQEDEVRINADVPKSLRKRVQIAAAMQERSMKEVIIEALDEYLSDRVPE
jgi:predicted HicB family RNase H-like nuclease